MIIGKMLYEKRGDIQRIAAKHGAYNVRVFGSFARSEAKGKSDIDLLVDAGPATSSWFPAGLILELKALLNCRVDVMTERALNLDIRKSVLQEAVQL